MKKRKESFFGLHFDFHASPEKCPAMGLNLREEDIREICRTVKPDFIQIDCKGHPGWCSYPTKLGNAMPEFATDTLALWRRVTREENVALYMHYSGVYDTKYCSEHPEERSMLADGSYHPSYTRLGGKYADELMIPQLCELAEVYEVDGVWLDGECWSGVTDFSPHLLRHLKVKQAIRLTVSSLPRPLTLTMMSTVNISASCSAGIYAITPRCFTKNIRISRYAQTGLSQTICPKSFLQMWILFPETLILLTPLSPRAMPRAQ